MMVSPKRQHANYLAHLLSVLTCISVATTRQLLGPADAFVLQSSSPSLLLNRNRFAHGRRSSRVPSCVSVSHRIRCGRLHATIAETGASSYLDTVMLEQLKSGASAAKEYAEMFGLSYSDAGFYAMFDAIRQSGIALGVKGQPFVLRNEDICKSLEETRKGMEEDIESPFAGFFTIDDLAKATEDDFLDAARGSTDNRKGWKVRAPGSFTNRPFHILQDLLSCDLTLRSFAYQICLTDDRCSAQIIYFRSRSRRYQIHAATVLKRQE